MSSSQPRLWESYPTPHQASLSRGVHPSDLMRVAPRPQHPVRRHTSDSSTRRMAGDHQKKYRPKPTRTSSDQFTSPQSSGYVSADIRTSDYPIWRENQGETRTSGRSGPEYRPHPQKYNEPHHYGTNVTDGNQQHLNKKPSVTSLDRNSYSEGSGSSYTGSSVDRLGPSLIVTDHTYRGSPASSQSDFSDPHSGRYSSRSTNYFSLPRSRSSLTAGTVSAIGGSTDFVEERSQRSYNHPSGVLLGTNAPLSSTGRVWPVEEEDGHLATHPPRTVHGTDELWLPRQISPQYIPQLPTSPSFSSETGSSEIPWYEQENPNIHSGLFFPSSRTLPPSHPPHSNSSNRPHSFHPRYDHALPTDNSAGVPRPSHSANKINYQTQSLDDDNRVFDASEQKFLAQQRLARYFSQNPNADPTATEHNFNPTHRRESSPADINRDAPAHQSHDQSQDVTPPAEKRSPSKHKKVARSKSSAFGKLVKKLSNKNKADKPFKDEGLRNGKTLSSSQSNLEGLLQKVRRSHSMELFQLGTPTENRKVATPSPSPGATPKAAKGLFRARRNSEPDLENVGTLFRSGSKKNLSVDTTDALFEAIEAEDEERCRELLEGQEFFPDINSTNEDKWTPLDLAAMLNENIALLLLAHGAKDSVKYYKEPEYRYYHIKELLKGAETERRSIGDMILQSGGGSKEMDKQLIHWTTRVNMLRKMKSNVEKTNVPGAPRDVQLIISSAQSLTVKFSEPESTNGAVVTRYKVQWSKSEKFVPEAGEFVMSDMRSKEYTIPGLQNGEKYFVRVSAFNLKGFGPPRTSLPTFAIPSSWHDCSKTLPRYHGSTTQMEIVAAKMSHTLSQHDLSTIPGTPSTSSNRRSIKKGFTKLFSQGVKFHKVLKTGVYLSSIVYSDDGRVLVTMDDNLPIVEVSDSHPSSIGSDFAWLAKVACTWENIQDMADVSDNYTSSPAIQFRNRLLHGMLMLQDGTGLQDLGLLHHHSYQDSHGSLIFVLVQYIEDYKGVQGVNTKWSSMAKLRRKVAQFEPGSDQQVTELSADQLLRDVPNVIHHHTRCSHILPRGLYLGYLKARVSSSVGSMTVVTSSTLPNVLPYYKIRNNPNISQSEWVWLQSIKNSETSANTTTDSYSPQSLQKTLSAAVDHFLEILGVHEEIDHTQLYTEEVIELNEDVTFLLLMPPPEHVCTPPGATDQFEGPSFSHTPIATFELLQLYTYQRPFILKFAEVSARLDIELLISQKKRREAFSKAEIAAAKSQHEELQKIQEDTEQTWKQMRWIETALKTARDVDMETRLVIKQLHETSQRLKRSVTSSSLSSTSSSGGPLSPTRKSLPNALTTASRYIRVYPAYETGLAKGTSVKIFLTPSTVTEEIILVSVEQLEKARKERGIPGHDIRGRDLTDFYLVAVLHGHREEVLGPRFTPLQLLNYSSKYKFIVRRWSLDQQTTDV